MHKWDNCLLPDNRHNAPSDFISDKKLENWSSSPALPLALALALSPVLPPDSPDFTVLGFDLGFDFGVDDDDLLCSARFRWAKSLAALALVITRVGLPLFFRRLASFSDVGTRARSAGSIFAGSDFAGAPALFAFLRGGGGGTTPVRGGGGGTTCPGPA